MLIVGSQETLKSVKANVYFKRYYHRCEAAVGHSRLRRFLERHFSTLDYEFDLQMKFPWNMNIHYFNTLD